MNSLETKRLQIRYFRPDDAQDLYEYLSNEEVVKYEPYETYTLEACKEEAVNRAKNKCFLAVVLKETGKVIGNLYFKKCHFETWELGYVFNLEYQKKGYAQEAVLGLFDHVFPTGEVRRIVAMCNPENSNSWKLLERVGMVREGHFRENIYFRVNDNNEPVWQDTYQYGILSKDYLSGEKKKDDSN